MGKQPKAVKVTASDAETGEVLQEKVITDDYVVVCAGRRYLHSTQCMGKTHIVCIKYDVSAPTSVAGDEGC